MKLLQFTITLLLVCLMTSAVAQIDRCRVTYAIDIEGMEEADAMTMAMLKDMTMVMSFQDQKARIEMDMGMVQVRSVMDQASGKMLILTDAMGTKSAQLTNINEEEKAQAAQDQEVNIRKTGKTKEIAGYTCYQTFVSPEDQEEIEMWCTPEIKVGNTANQYIYKGMDGFPLEMLVDQQGMKMRMVASSVDTDKMDDSFFSLEVPEGYQLQNENR